MHKNLTLEKIKPYLETNSKEEIASIFGCSVFTIRRFLIKNGIQRYPKNYLCNHNYFKKWSSNMAYILGFITADGNISASRPHLRIELSRKDRSHLENIRNEIYPKSKIYDYEHLDKRTGMKYESSLWVFHSKEIINDLKQYSIFPNKTGKHKIDFSIPSENIHDYVRGFFDGDGTVYHRQDSKTREVSFSCSSVEFLESLAKILPINSFIDYQSSRLSVYRQSDIMIFRDWLYSNSTLFLQRKKDILYEQ